MNKAAKLSIIIIALASIMVTGAGANEKPFLHKALKGERLQATARNQGYVKVIVRFDVPELEKFVSASNQYRKKITENRALQNALNADRALSSEIASVSNKILSRLQTRNFVYKKNHTYATLPLIAMDVSEDSLVLLNEAEEVLSISEDYPIPPVLDNTVSTIGADEIWDDGYTGAGWHVAVLDTGIRSSHDFFAGKTILEACFSADGHCPNNQTEMIGPDSAVHHSNIYESFDHGTHVTGIAVGNDSDQQLFGVAKDSGIIAIQVFSRFSGTENCGIGVNNCVLSYISDQIKGLEHVYSLRTDYNIASVNLSLGGGKYSSQSLCDADNAAMKLAIDNLREVGIATIIASGNDGFCDGISAPACISSAIAVGATTDNDQETSFSNWDEDLLDLFAPGYLVFSSTGTSDSSYQSWNGTSMATPHVAGAWALFRQKHPELSVSSLLNAVSTTGTSVNTICIGSGSKPRLEAYEALNYIVPDAPPAAPTNLQAALVSYNQIKLNWSDSSNNESGFYIERKVGGQGIYRQIATTNANVTTYTDTGLDKSKTYYYRLSAHNLTGNSDYSNIASATTVSWNQSIVWRHTEKGTVYSWLMNGTAVVFAASAGTVDDLKWKIVETGDFDADGNADMLWRHTQTGVVNIWLMNGTAIDSAASAGTVEDPKWKIAGTGDFNADGNADILWRHTLTGMVYIWLMNGTAVESAASAGTVEDPNWLIAGTGDFDADGNADILWQHAQTGMVYIWLMNGPAVKSAATAGTVKDLNWLIAGTGDFDADGKADILWRHTQTGMVYIWLMNATAIESAASAGNVEDLNWKIAGTGDFDADGNADVLWKHMETGMVYIWLMNGPAVESAASAGAVEDLKWRIAGNG